jgi:2-polyprenyl-3-methyl-5-hydroxy-6-metoxy-1,4-benzoquinol methylase
MVSKLNNRNILEILKQSCYMGNDVRACWIADYELDTDIIEYKPWARWSLQHLNMYKGFFNLVSLDRPIRILDAACGIGFNTKMIKKSFSNATIVGIDIEPNSIKMANTYNSHPDITYIQDDLLKFSCGKFDYIFMLEILEHIKAEYHFQLVDRLLGMLNKDGILFLSTPNELDNPDAPSEHIGLLNRQRTREFIKRYQNNIILSEFYDNLKLDTSDYTIHEPIETYENTSSGIGGLSIYPNKSHFKIALKLL